MKIEERLKQFIDLCYKGKVMPFARTAGIQRTVVSRWIEGASPVLQNALLVENAGLNVGWLFSGRGSMFAVNGTGKKFKEDEKIKEKILNLVIEQSQLNLEELNKEIVNNEGLNFEKLNDTFHDIFTDFFITFILNSFEEYEQQVHSMLPGIDEIEKIVPISGKVRKELEKRIDKNTEDKNFLEKISKLFPPLLFLLEDYLGNIDSILHVAMKISNIFTDVKANERKNNLDIEKIIERTVERTVKRLHNLQTSINNETKETNDKLPEIIEPEQETGQDKTDTKDKPTIYNKKYLNIDEAVEYLNMAKATIYIYTSQKKIPHCKRGRNLFFSRDELDNWIEGGRRRTKAEIDQIAEDYVNSKKRK